MPNLRDIRRHIRSVESIAKVTGAMEAVAIAKNHRFRSRAQESLPFARASWQILTHLAAASNPEISESVFFSGYDHAHRMGMLLIAGDRGMAGGYNRRAVQTAVEYIETQDLSASILVVGKEGRDRMSAEGYEAEGFYPLADREITLENTTQMTSALIGGYQEGRFQRVVIVYTPFEPGRESVPRTRQLLPIRPAETAASHQYIFEPPAEQMLESLLSQVLRFQIYQALLASLTAEHASRALAMGQATQNGKDLIERLTLEYNKARQESITKELMDIVGGATTLYNE
ncbi:MAG: ATP synthase F1 subunit gamma [Chloroflexota bacterium]|nr:ATP synthase F1 subunit gamma [Chloroflexota bacterium]